MPKCVLTLAVLSLIAIPTTTAATGVSETSPQAVLQRFCEMDGAGAGLTADGWYHMSNMFLQPGKLQKGNAIVIKDFVISPPLIKNNSAEFYVEYIYLGRLDVTKARYMRLPDPLPGGPVKVRVEYYLTSADTNAASAPNRTGSPPTWKIERSGEGDRQDLHITVDTAIEYAIKIRDSATDPAIRQNAKVTIAGLKHLR